MGVTPGYKQTEAGIIPEEWELKRFAELFAFRNGVNADKGSYGQGIRFINVLEPITYSHIRGPEITGRVTLPESVAQSYAVRRGDVLFNRTSETQEEVGLAATYLGTERVVFGGFVIRGRLLDQDFDPVYSGYALRAHSIRSQIIPMGQGAIRANIGQHNLSLVVASVPPLPEQRAIAEVLNDVDALLDALNRLIAKKRDLKQAAMQQLLTSQSRLPGFDGEWEVKRIGNFTDCTAGGTPSTSVASYWGGSIPWMNSGELNLKSVREVKGRITEAGLRNSSTKMIPKKCVLIGLAGQGKTRGTVALNLIELCTNQSIAAIFPNPSFVPEYLYHNLDSRYDELRELSAGDGGRGGLNLKIIKSIDIPLPTLPEQTAIAEVLTDMDRELAALKERREKTRAIKQSMMQELLTGRTRLVSPAPSVVRSPQNEKTTKAKPAHNWQINEAVIIGVLTLQFGTEEWPLPRKRRVKLMYLLHRHIEGKAEGYVKKAAGPYNPKTKYQGPERIAVKNGYVREHNNGTYAGFVAAEKIAQAEQYFAGWYPDAKEWLEQFRFEKTDELELLATVDMAVEDLRSGRRAVELNAVKDVIRTHPEWQAKLSRSIFSDDNITRAINKCINLFAS